MSRAATIIVVLTVMTAGLYAQDGDDINLRPSPFRWLVKFDPGVADSAKADLAESFDAERIELGNYADFELFRFYSAPGIETLERMQSDPSIIYAEREARYRTTGNYRVIAGNDPLGPLQWSHRMIRLSTAHKLNFGSDPSVLVAILDSGIAYLNSGRFRAAPDLTGTTVFQGYDFVSDDPIAIDEGDGYLGHGTFTAGVVAQTTFNSRGTGGIAFNSALLPVRVVNRRGISKASELARGIRFAAAGGAGIILLGVAGPTDSRAVREAIEFAYTNGVAVIAPAGNGPDVLFPARYSQVLSVGAVDAAGNRAYYSPTRGPVDIFAPGGDLRPGIDANNDNRPDGILAESFLGKNYGEFSALYLDGTSAAAAHVAGAAALLVSQSGPLDPEVLYHALRSGARKIGGLPVLDAARILLARIIHER